jgi:acetyl/propionyl-CoA carboxylase alpha subunit
VRVDSGIETGAEIGTQYDPLLAKVSVWAENREAARARLARALSETSVVGIDTNLGFLTRLLGDPEFVRGEYDTEFVERRSDLYTAPPLSELERDDLLSVLAALEIGHAPAQSRARAEHGLSPWVAAERARLR